MRIYFMGICGTAMGNAALLMRSLGHEVLGSDTGVYPPMSDHLRGAGIEILEGWSAERLAQLKPDLVVVGNVASRGHVADDDEVRLELGQAFRGPPFQDFDAGATEVIGHRWVDARVGPQHLVTQRAHQQSGIAHRGAADAHEINPHTRHKSPPDPEGEPRTADDPAKRRTPATLRRPGSGTFSDCTFGLSAELH